MLVGEARKVSLDRAVEESEKQLEQQPLRPKLRDEWRRIGAAWDLLSTCHHLSSGLRRTALNVQPLLLYFSLEKLREVF